MMKIRFFAMMIFMMANLCLFAIVPKVVVTNNNPIKTGDNVLSNLPLRIIPAAQNSALPMVFFISGDGGWTNFAQSLSEVLAKRGYPVVGLDARKYFWKSKTLEEMTNMTAEVVEHYSAVWKTKGFILFGFSFGADIVPFITNNLSVQMSGNLKKTLCLSPGEYADFEVHLADMLNMGSSKNKLSVIDEVKKIKPSQVVCIFAGDEEIAVRNKFMVTKAEIVTLPGDHHYNNDYKQLEEMIMEQISK